MTDYSTAGNGLKKVFIGEILAIFSFIPLLGGILALVGGILSLVGLYQASKVAYGYRTAFQLSIASIVVELLGVFIPGVSLVGVILSIAVVYFVCMATGELLVEKGDSQTAAKGQFVWKLYAVCGVIVLVCTLVAFIPGAAILAAVVLLPTAIASLVAGIQYLIFLYRASEYLLF